MLKAVLIFTSTVLTVAVLAVGSWWFINARSERASNACVMHLRDIAALKERWGVDNRKTTNDVPTWDDLLPYMRSGEAVPHCPAGGVYEIGRLDHPPTCSIGGRDHTLPRYAANGTPKQ